MLLTAGQGLWAIWQYRADAEARLLSEAGRTAARVVGMLSMSGGTPDAAAALVAVDVAMDDDRVYGVRVQTAQGVQVGMRRNYQWEPVPWDDEITEETVQGMSQIKEEGRPVGSVEIYMSRRLTNEECALTVRAEQLQRQVSTCDARLEQNRAARTAIDTRRQQHAAVRARWQWVHALAATANGAVPGKEKIMLETYIQTAYFDRILGRANTRLLIMSGGQYELRRCARAGDNRSQTGLELEVIDHYNGTARSVKTLSGGETFAASLSLALGLSDEVQATAGGVQLEAMFVDEGFGSLDSEALQQALAALVGVSGGSRIVGIISHVAELKDRIDRQIIVTKDRSGGSRVQVQA